jgi:hypothetical protein
LPRNAPAADDVGADRSRPHTWAKKIHRLAFFIVASSTADKVRRVADTATVADGQKRESSEKESLMKVLNSRWMLGGVLSLGLAGALVMAARAEDKEDKDEPKITVDQLPAPVQATLKSESGDGKIGDIDMETKQVTYEADVVINGKNYEVKIADDGTLLSKKLEKDEDEKDEKGEDKK